MQLEHLFSVTGKTVLVTGGSRGIGEMIAAGFVANGAKVYISARKAAACEETARRLADTHGGTCIALPADLSGVAGVAALAEQLEAHEDHLDVLVNNAGITWDAPLEEYPEAGWDSVMDTNVKGVFFLTQRLLPMLEAAGDADRPARVINIGSIDGIRNTSFETFAYGPSKAALHSLTRLLALRLASRNIIVNGIAPGPFPTWMLSAGLGGGGDVDNTDWSGLAGKVPLGRIGRPEDIAGLAIYLSSNAGSYVVGEIIACDGGVLIR